ncbi:MAG: hypothetical protein IKE06_07040 [Solobacterium sp.]|nr:hypothetical protein [Solobacterium sp.]MBR2830456.1 hypothetical protein [Solobacterium sp.]MBR3126916.1 hypothetical protein [Solobacterium sp.]
MPDNESTYEHKLRYNNAYNRAKYRSFSIRFDKEKEKKIIRWLEKQPSLKAYVLGLIEADMAAAKKKK